MIIVARAPPADVLDQLVMLKSLLAAVICLGALFWLVVALVCCYADSGAPHHPNVVVALPCSVAALLSAAVGVALHRLPKGSAPWTILFVVGMLLFLAGFGFAAAHASDSVDAADRSSLQGVVGSLLGLSLMLRPLWRARQNARLKRAK